MTMICYGLYYVLRENFEYSEPEILSTKDKSIQTLIEEEKIEINDVKENNNYRRNKRKNNNNKKKNKVKSSKNKDK
jgi:hypothetical protein